MMRIVTDEKTGVGTGVCSCNGREFSLHLLTVIGVTGLFAMCLNCKRFTKVAEYDSVTSIIEKDTE